MINFNNLRQYRVILVSGAHRSGTTITAHIIAQETGKGYLDEHEDGLHDQNYLARAIRYNDNVVIQCPGMANCLEKFGAQDDVAVVFVKRDPAAIRASMARLPNNSGAYLNETELNKYVQYRDQGYDIVDAKLLYWEIQKKRILHAFEIRYEELTKHPLFVEKEKRSGWSIKQWKV